MDRLHKKCAIASTGFHLLLLLILMVGPAFFSSKQNVPDLSVINFVPFKTVDEMMSGGGNPNAKPPPAAMPMPPQPQPKSAPPPSKPEPEKPKQPEPTPPKEVVKPAEASESLEATEKRSKKEFKLVPKLRVASNSSTEPSEADKRAKQLTETRQRVAQQLGRAAAALGESFSSGTTVEIKGPGGGGVPYANFLQAVMSVYDRAWNLPEGVSDNDASTLVSVAIARDGKVISARIIRPSGNREVDRSVQNAIDRVSYAAPLPETARESQRTVEINFSVKAKRLLG